MILIENVNLTIEITPPKKKYLILAFRTASNSIVHEMRIPEEVGFKIMNECDFEVIAPPSFKQPAGV